MELAGSLPDCLLLLLPPGAFTVNSEDPGTPCTTDCSRDLCWLNNSLSLKIIVCMPKYCWKILLYLYIAN